MFTRIRWFAYGVAATLGLSAVVLNRARTMRERLDRQGLTKVSASLAADGLEAAGKRLQKSTLRVAPEGRRAGTG